MPSYPGVCLLFSWGLLRTLASLCLNTLNPSVVPQGGSQLSSVGSQRLGSNMGLEGSVSEGCPRILPGSLVCSRS